MKTEEDSPQGGNLSPLLANIYLDRFDKEFEGRGVKVIRYADDIILLALSIRAAERLLGTSTEYLEKNLKLKVNTEKSRAVQAAFGVCLSLKKRESIPVLHVAVHWI